MTTSKTTHLLKRRASELGFQYCGVCLAVAPVGAQRIDEWLAAGYAGQMHYLADRREAYDDPRYVLDGARSVVMLAMHYLTEEPRQPAAGQGRVSRYAWGERDYHHVIRELLHQLADYLRELAPNARTRGIVDTAPLMEREFAQLAGLGWIGKNTLLLSKGVGSYFFLAALLTDQVLEYDEPFTADHCGTCTACLDACPTQAFPQPYVLNATRCISYLTIELQDSIPKELRPGIGDWLFGCDVCQEVCPWNHAAPRSTEPAFAPLVEMNPVELIGLFHLTDADFRVRFRHTPLWRAHRRGLLRNAAVILGNQRHVGALPALRQALGDDEPLVRGAAAWALGQLAIPEAKDALLQALDREKSPAVREEIAEALRPLSNQA